MLHLLAPACVPLHFRKMSRLQLHKRLLSALAVLAVAALPACRAQNALPFTWPPYAGGFRQVGGVAGPSAAAWVWGAPAPAVGAVPSMETSIVTAAQ